MWGKQISAGQTYAQFILVSIRNPQNLQFSILPADKAGSNFGNTTRID
jgi:hypothetical protein